MAVPPPLGGRVEDFIVSNVRKEHPWMKTEAVHAVAKLCKETVERTVLDQNSAVERSQARCNFLSLSPELRNRIYELALHPEYDGDGGVYGCRAIRINSLGGGPFLLKKWMYWAEQPAITRLSRKIREESLPVYYGSNNFVIYSHADSNESESWEFDFGGAEEWLECVLPTNRSLIKHLEVLYDTAIGPVGYPELASEFVNEASRYLCSNKIHLPVVAKALGYFFSESDHRAYWAPWDLDFAKEQLAYGVLPPVVPTSMKFRPAD